MAKRVGFSGQHLNLPDIAEHYADVEVGLRLFFRSPGRYPSRFSGFTVDEIRETLDSRLMEEQQHAALCILAAIEGAFRVDYLERVYARKKDDLSVILRELHKARGPRASLEREILQAWRDSGEMPTRLVGDLRGAFKYRHWLAHGRYWTPKFGQRYDYQSIYELAEALSVEYPDLAI